MGALVGAALILSISASVALASSPHVDEGIDTSTCAACHAAHTAISPRLIRHVGTDPAFVSVCLACHDGTTPDAANVVSGTPDSFGLVSGHSLTVASPGTVKIEGCATCHDTHGTVEQGGRMIPAKTINGVSVTSAGKQLCLACHSSSDAWYGPGYPSTSAPTRDATGFPVAGTWPGPATYASSTNAHRLLPETTITVGAGSPQPREAGDCRYCHASHRGANTYDSLLSTFTVPTLATLGADKADGSYADLCLKCHGGVKPSGFATTPVDIRSFVTSSSPSAGHSIVTSGGLLPVGSPLPCFECHNPHGSARGNGALLSDERGTSLGTTTAAGVRTFCFTCHTTAGSTPAGWDSAAGAYTVVTATDKVVGLPRDGGVLHLSAQAGHAQGDTESCYTCHGSDYTAGGNNVHNPAATTLFGGLGIASVGASDTVPPITTADLSLASSGQVSLSAMDTGSGVAFTYFTLDGGGLNVGTQVLVSIEGTYTLQYWSTDVAGNVEAPNTAVFHVDRTPPVTTSDAVASYAGTATISLTAVDEPGGSGVAATYSRLDGGQETTLGVVTTDLLGDHALVFWSVDNAGNIEAAHTATFTVTAGPIVQAAPGTGLSVLYPLLVSRTISGLGLVEPGWTIPEIVGMRPPDGFRPAALSASRFT